MNKLSLVEPIPVDDDLVTALSHVEDIGFGGRLVFYAAQTCFETGGTIYVVKRKLVVPHDGLVAGNRIVRAFIDGAPHRPPVRVVK